MPVALWVPDGLAWIRSVLIADTTVNADLGGRIYKGVGKEGTAAPYVTLSVQAAPDLTSLSGHRILTNPRILLKVWTKDDQSRAEAIAGNVDALLQGQRGIVFGQTMINGVKRIEYWDRPEVDQGVVWRSVGGEYLIEVSAP